MTDHEIRDAFERAMRDAGLSPVFKAGEQIEFGQTPDRNPRRFHIAGDSKGTRNGWYIVFADGTPAGEFGSWKTGEKHSWCAKKRSELSTQEREEIERRIAEAQKEREAAQRQREGEAAKRANIIWNEATPIDGDAHPYLERKGVRAHGLRIGKWPVRNSKGETFRYIENTLLVPIWNARGKIVSLQAIFPAVDQAFGRDKDFLVGGQKRGCFYMIGTPPGPGGTVAFCEGYATAESIHQATGWCVVVAWDAYNLPHVAKTVRAAMPQAVFVFCADNDQWTTQPVNNPGVEYARRACAEVGGRFVAPAFADLEGRPTDFNDLHQREGLDVVMSQVMQTAPAPAPEDVPAAMTPTEGKSATVRYYCPINPMSVDTATPFPDIDGKGNPLPTALNLAEMLNRIGAIVRYNVISKNIEILIPRLETTPDQHSNASYNELSNWCRRFRMSTADFDGNLVSVSNANNYNPVATWIDSRPWDGVSRLKAFFDTVVAKTDQTLSDGRSLKETLIRRWLISAVASAYRNGTVSRGVLTFVSEQNLGKTLWAKRLAPAELNVIADGEILNPSDKDSVMKVVRNWIVELGEVDATFRKSDVAALKAFISKDKDTLRRPYQKTEDQFGRRTVFFASVNDPQFLHDPTGNTRWWTIHVEALDNAHTIDMQQLWAEVKSLYEAGESWHLTREEVTVLNAHNRDHEAINPVHDLIDRAFDWSSPKTTWTRPMRATDIALEAGIDRPTKKDVNEAAAYVTARYGVEKQRYGKDRVGMWPMPIPRRARRDAPPEDDRPF
jgi:putative DNA primase/helicase